MADPEMSPKNEIIGEDELRKLLDKGSKLSMEKGAYKDNGGQVYDEKDGLPVVDEAGQYELEVPRITIPQEAARELNLGEQNVELIFAPACYHHLFGQEPEYAGPVFMAVAHRPVDDPIASVEYGIIEEEGGQVWGQKQQDLRKAPSRPPIESILSAITEESVSESVENYLSARAFEAQTGLSGITRGEYQAIDQILDIL